MAELVNLDELLVYRDCPEKAYRLREAGDPSIPEIEQQFQANLRRLFVRYYGEFLSGAPPPEATLRRMWSTMWDAPVGMINRYFQKNTRSFLNATMTDEERMLLRGAKIINKLTERPLHRRIKPLMVDEKFTLKLADVTIIGTYDLVFEDRKQYWVMDWSTQPGRYDTRFDVRHSILIEYLRERTSHTPTVIVDYLWSVGDILEASPRSPDQIAQQLKEANQIGRSIAQNIRYRRVGTQCRECPFRASCIGVQVVKAKRPNGRPRERPLPE